MADNGTLYRAAQGRVIALVNTQNATTPVPACPEWTVKDVVAHLAGCFSDIQRGRLEDATSEAWTAAHVAQRRDRSIGEIGAEWHVLTHTGAWILAGEYGSLLVADLICHEFDIRGALGNREARGESIVRPAAEFFLTALDRVFRNGDIPALRFQVEDNVVITVGDGEPQGSVTLTWFELLRTLSGRRSRAQAKTLPWEGDPEIWLDHLFLLGPAEADIEE